MTGMDVLKRCRSCKGDVARMRVKKACTDDARLRITRATDAQGHGAGGDKMGEMTARIDALERGISAREAAYGMEVIEALRLIGEIENAEIGAVLYAFYVSGDSDDAIAIGRKMSKEGVRSLRRRGEAEMRSTGSLLERCEKYAFARETENWAMNPNKAPYWP